MARKLAAQLLIDSNAIDEAIRRGLLTFKRHRNAMCWRFGDSRNGSFRRIDGKPFQIGKQSVKAEAETSGASWHRLIRLDDVVENDRRDILLVPEGSKDALAALHFAAAEGTVYTVGIVAALGAGVRLLPDDLEKFGGRRIRIIGDADPSGAAVVDQIGPQLATIAAEVQVFNISGLRRDDGSEVKDLFNLTRIAYDDFESDSNLLSITDLDSKGQRIRVVINEFLSSLSPSPHGYPQSHKFPVYPVSSSQALEKELLELARRNTCKEEGTAKKLRFKLLRDLAAVENRISRKLTIEELRQTFDQWYLNSLPHLDPKKTRDDYLAMFFAESGKVRVPTGDGKALKTALKYVSSLSISDLPLLPEMADAPESWRRVAALHRELARLSANGTYFLSCRDAAKADERLNKDSASTINHALARLQVIKLARIGDVRPGGKASEFRYLLSL